MALDVMTRAGLDLAGVDRSGTYLFEWEGYDSGRWWIHAAGMDGRLQQGRFELANVKPGEPGPGQARFAKT